MDREPSEGARLLKDKIGPTQADLAEKLGVTQQALSQWIRGEARPAAHRRKLIEALLGIPEDTWLTSDERAALSAAADAPASEPRPSPTPPATKATGTDGDR